MSMEPIRQNAAFTSSEEAVFNTDLEIESGDKETEKIFDSTLDQMLTEETKIDYEDMIDQLMESNGQDSLVSYVHQNQYESEIVTEETADKLTEHTLFPIEIVKTDLSLEDSRHVQSNFLRKSIPIAEEMIKMEDPRIVTDENNFLNLEEAGIAEKGLQPFFDESTPDSSPTVIQNFLHQVEQSSDKNNLLEDSLQTVLNQYTEEAVEIPRSSLHKIMHKTSNQTVFSEEEVLLNEVVSLNNNDIKSANHKPVDPILFTEDAVLPNEAVALDVNNFKSANHKTENPTILAEEAVLPEEAVSRAGHGIKSEMSNTLVGQIQNHEEIALANQKIVGDAQTFNLKNETLPFSSKLIRELSQDSEIYIGDHDKKLFDGNVMSKEQLKASQSLQIVENIKAHEVYKTKASINDVEELLTEAKPKVSDGLQISEKDKPASETQNLIRPKVSDFSKNTDSFKFTEDLQGQAKGKVSEDVLAKEMFKSPDELKENLKSKEIFQNNVFETTKVSSEKLPVAPINQFRTLASKETKVSGSSNFGIEPVMSSGLSTSPEIPGNSFYKTSDSMNSLSESLRNADLPFDIQQLVSRVRVMRGNGVEEMTLRLHPEELGHITLKVRQTGGDLMIDMRVDNQLAKQIVESGFDSLRSRFLDQEFAYKDLAINVDINQRDSQFGSDRQFEEFEDELFSSQREKEQEISTLEETPRERHRTDSGLNLYV